MDLGQHTDGIVFTPSVPDVTVQGRIQGEGAGGAHPSPPGMTCGRFLINTVHPLDRHTKSALSFDMYSQQFTLCYFLVKSPLLRIRS